MAHWSYSYPRAARFVRSRAFLLVAIPVVLGLIAGVVIAISQLVGRPPVPTAGGTSSENPSSGDGRVQATVQPTLGTSNAEVPVPPTKSELVPAGPTAVGFTCWNGDAVLDLTKCARPRTDAQAFKYLEYVYPGLADVVGRCERRPTPKKYSDVAAFLNCPVAGVSNVRYRYWRDRDDANGHYAEDDKKFDGASPYAVYIGDQRVGGWVRAYNKSDDGLLTVTMFLPEQHLSLSIEGKSMKGLWAEFERTMIRPVGEILGYPSADGPSLTVLGRG